MSVRFTAVLEQAEGMKATGIEVPADVVGQLASGNPPAVLATLNGYQYPITLGVMGGRTLLPVSAAVREAAGVRAGDTVDVELALATGPREVKVPDDLAAAFAANPSAKTFFDTLSNSLQRMHIDNVNGAKAADTRARRVDKVVELMLAGKPR